MATKFRHRLITATAALACALAAGPLHAIEQGAFEAGLYTAPGAAVHRQVAARAEPDPDRQLRRADGRRHLPRRHRRALRPHLHAELRRARGCGQRLRDGRGDPAQLVSRRDVPALLRAAASRCTVIHEEPGTFDGAPAWFAVMHLPRGSAMFRNDAETGLPTRLDSIRGVVVFSRGRQTYLIMTETAPELEWNAFMPKLADFYRGISFSNPDGLDGLGYLRRPFRRQTLTKGTHTFKGDAHLKGERPLHHFSIGRGLPGFVRSRRNESCASLL